MNRKYKNIGAMVAHAKRHDTHDFTSIYQVKHKHEICFRPAEHTVDATRGKLFQGSDARFLKHVFNNGLKVCDDNLSCRKCDLKMKYNVRQMNNRKLVKVVQKLYRHENICKGKKKAATNKKKKKGKGRRS